MVQGLDSLATPQCFHSASKPPQLASCLVHHHSLLLYLQKGSSSSHPACHYTQPSSLLSPSTELELFTCGLLSCLAPWPLGLIHVLSRWAPASILCTHWSDPPPLLPLQLAGEPLVRISLKGVGLLALAVSSRCFSLAEPIYPRASGMHDPRSPINLLKTPRYLSI